MNRFTTIKLNVDRAPVALITLARPDALNAINAPMRAELPVALNEVAGDDRIRAVVLAGEGRVFSAGADLKENMPELDITRILMDEYKPSFDAIAGMEKPVISAISGSAAGIALSLALVCDLTVMADDAFLLCPFSTINLIPDGGGNFLLSRQLGYKRAYEMAIEAERMPADRALELGLVNRLAGAGDVTRYALDWAARLAGRAPMAIARTKRLMRFAMENGYEATFREEARVQQQCLASEDFAEGRNAFIEKRPPDFKGK